MQRLCLPKALFLQETLQHFTKILDASTDSGCPLCLCLLDLAPATGSGDNTPLVEGPQKDSLEVRDPQVTNQCCSAK